MNKIDLKKEQQASLARPRYKYSLMARFFFLSMDMVTGKKTTLAKAKLIETLASIPYRAWELRQYTRMTRKYKDIELVKKADSIMTWSREAQDNEYWHLIVINEKMKEDGIKDPWYLAPLIPRLMVATYVALSGMMSRLNIRGAFLFNAEFEDHAEHVYANFVEDNPDWANQPVKSEVVRKYAELDNWADIFRRIGLDERDHMNNSFSYCGKPEHIVKYDGMPPIAG